ncbi:MAG: zinc ribbon domain-containing protein [Actinomycetota bacterium]
MDRLLELQELDLSVDRLEARRTEIESGAELEEARTRADAVEQKVGELRLALDSIGREERRLENEISSVDQRIQAEQKRLYDGSVANPKELSSIQAEIESLGRRKARLEDEEIGQMEHREDLESRLPPLEKELGELRQRVEETEASAQSELGKIAGELDQLRSSRGGLAAEIDEELLEIYEDLRAHKKGVGAAALIEGVCQGCHEKLSAMALDKLKRTDGIRRCEHCRRIVIFQ